MGAGDAASLRFLQRLAWVLRQLLQAVSTLLSGSRRLESLHGRVALVTGAGGGLGRQLALQLAGCGCRLVCVDSDIEAATTTADIINKVGAGSAAAYASDPGDRQLTLQLSRKVLGRHERVDILALADSPRPDIDVCDHIAAQLWAVLGFVPAMASRGGGRVLVVCSERTPDEAAPIHSVATASLVEALSGELRACGVQLTCAHRYRLLKHGLALPIPELSDERAAGELVAALQRGQPRVSLPRRPLFWHNVLRMLHPDAGVSLRDAYRLETPIPTNAEAEAAPVPGDAVKS